MTTPSPAAQAIASAFNERYELCGPFDVNWDELCLAAALRAAVDQVAPKCFVATGGDYAAGANNERIVIRNQLLAIAAELEAQP